MYICMFQLYTLGKTDSCMYVSTSIFMYICLYVCTHYISEHYVGGMWVSGEESP